jgi:hypothetical protein
MPMLKEYVRAILLSYAQKGISLEKFNTLILEYVGQIIKKEFDTLSKEEIIGIKDNKLVHLKSND